MIRINAIAGISRTRRINSINFRAHINSLYFIQERLFVSSYNILYFMEYYLNPEQFFKNNFRQLFHELSHFLQLNIIFSTNICGSQVLPYLLLQKHVLVCKAAPSYILLITWLNMCMQQLFNNFLNVTKLSLVATYPRLR